ncbi:MAG: MATE family efflux transporter [Planctomycetota bacterium]|nr:MAG: MATE family efflux transporter [Planctomycetota bacterium]
MHHKATRDAAGRADEQRPAPHDDARGEHAYIPVADELGAPEQEPPLTTGRLESLPRGSINRQVFILALPMLGEQFGNFLVGFVDTYLAGQVSKEATAATGTGGYMGWFVSLAFSLVGTGAAALAARSIGAGDLRTANRVLNQALVMALGLGAIVAATIYAAAGGFAALLSATPEAHALFVQYIRIDSFGYALYSLMLVGGGVVRAAGDTRTPMAIMLIVNLVNAAVSAALVFWYGMGVAGIAIGTVVARTLGGLLMFAVLWRGVRGLQIRTSLMRRDRQTIRRILNIGVPASADAALIWVGQMAFIAVVAHSAAGAAATVNYATHMIAMRMEAISFLPAVAWMTAAATLVGQYLGAGRPEDASRAGHRAALQGVLLTTAVGAAFYFFAEPIFQWMSTDEQVRRIGPPAFRIMAFIQPALGAAIIYTGALRGAGDTKMMMYIQLLGGLVLRAPGAYLFGVVLGGGLIGCWCGMWLDNLTKCVCGWSRFVHGGWKRLKV